MKIDTHMWRRVKDIVGIALFIVAVFIGSWLINIFVFRSFTVEGPSMEKTLFTGDRLIVNRLPVTWAHFRSTDYVPPRGQVIVFRNPKYKSTMNDEYVVKRVIAFAGERVVVQNGTVTVYTKQNPEGIDVNAAYPEAQQPTNGDQDTIVPSGTIFVLGDHRQQGYSCDSRDDCIGSVTLNNVVGPVVLRLYPFNQIRTF